MKNFVSKFLKGDSRTQCHQHQLNTTEVRRKDLKTDGSFKGKSGKGVGEPYGIYQQPNIEIFGYCDGFYLEINCFIYCIHVETDVLTMDK